MKMQNIFAPTSFILGIAFSLLSFISCSNQHRNVTSKSEAIQHDIWDGLVKKHVTPEGVVDYKGFMNDSTEFNAYIDLLSNNHPNDSNWTDKEKIAYWINAYNAFTVQLVNKHYPIKSIKDIAGAIPFINSPWDIKFIKIEGYEYDLNNIEHNILRRDFVEPRIHFAINCASFSCPRMRNEAFTAERLDEQLEDAAKKFINNPAKNEITKDNIKISKIFSWFSGDFTKVVEGGIIEYLNKYSNTQIDKDANIDYLDYNWSLNE